MNIMITNNGTIHKGDNTHHQDQSIVPINFKTINTIARSPVKPMPDLAIVGLFSDMISP